MAQRWVLFIGGPKHGEWMEDRDLGRTMAIPIIHSMPARAWEGEMEMTQMYEDRYVYEMSPNTMENGISYRIAHKSGMDVHQAIWAALMEERVFNLNLVKKLGHGHYSHLKKEAKAEAEGTEIGPRSMFVDGPSNEADFGYMSDKERHEYHERRFREHERERSMCAPAPISLNQVAIQNLQAAGKILDDAPLPLGGFKSDDPPAQPQSDWDKKLKEELDEGYDSWGSIEKKYI